jgi:peptide chain release factor 1
MRLPQARLDQVLDRFREVEARMGAATDGQEIVRLSKEHAELRPVAEAVEGLARARAEGPELEERCWPRATPRWLPSPATSCRP